MCLNRPKASAKISKSEYIRVGENSYNSKYEFLKLFYTKWNQITKPSPRLIVDTHAGTGLVILKKKYPLLNTSENQLIYGSPLIAILKTLKLSTNLKIILNEVDNRRFILLERCIKAANNKGLPIFEKINQDFNYKSIQTNRKRKKKVKKEFKYPESFNSDVPRGYKRVWEKSNALVELNNKKIEKVIDVIFDNHLKFNDNKNELKPKALFLVDPCGVVSWKKVIEKICLRSNKKEGTDLILNWSWDAINRNLSTISKKDVLSEIYGIPLDKIETEFENIHTMSEFFLKYKNQLKKYFEYVVEVGVPRDRKTKPKQSTHKKYYLVLCTNNRSALSLAGYQIRKIKDKLRGRFKSLDIFINSSKN